MTRAGLPDAPLEFSLPGAAGTIALHAPRLVVAGYTGRDQEAVVRHIEELAAIGVPPPACVPAFWTLDSSLATQDSRISVTGADTSGEVELVLLRSAGRLYVTVGSDHTDRGLERISVADAKRACPKPVGRTALALPPEPAGYDWDGLRLTCQVDGERYQDGLASALRTPPQLLDGLAAADGDDGRDLIMFCGTVPLLSGRFLAGSSWQLGLEAPLEGPAGRLAHTYSVTVTG